VRPISVPDKIGISYVHVGHKDRQGRVSKGWEISRRGAEAQSRNRSVPLGSSIPALRSWRGFARAIRFLPRVRRSRRMYLTATQRHSARTSVITSPWRGRPLSRILRSEAFVTNGNGRDHTSLRDAQPRASALGVRPSECTLSALAKAPSSPMCSTSAAAGEVAASLHSQCLVFILLCVSAPLRETFSPFPPLPLCEL
jgi:hypothetical protein